ncbi:MAG: ubiquinol-cytochrome c reductase iron-sulfur subunit [Rhizomicrobium sp.]
MSDHSVSAGEIKRRDFLYVATGAFAAVGGAIALWPFIQQMEPSSDVLAAGGPLAVDVSKIDPGQQILVMWRSKPIFVVNRTAPMLATLKEPALLAKLSDPNSKAKQQPAYAENWSRSLKPEYLVLVAICTHLGCIPGFKPNKGQVDASWQGGYLCPCHGSRYDLAGRVHIAQPAPLNLPVPPYHFTDAKTLVIGENPKGSAYSLSEVETL